MSDLAFTIIDARVEPYAVIPTLLFRLQISESSGERIHAIALRCQIQVEPRQRRYSHHEEDLLIELFGAPDRWSGTLRSLLWTQASLMVPGFEGTTVIDLPITCTYDFEVVAAKYLEALEDGEVLAEALDVERAARPRRHGLRNAHAVAPVRKRS